MQGVLKIINEIRATSGTNDKIEILKNNSDNELLKKVLFYTYNPFYRYGFSIKNINPIKVNGVENDKDLFDILDLLIKSNINNTLRAEVNVFLGSLEKDECDFYSAILQKDLKLGMNAKTINKAIPKLIPVWAIQGGKPRENLSLKKDEEFVLQDKANGIRSSYLNGVCYTRSGKEHVGFSTIINQIKEIFGNDYFIDGEFVRENIDNVSDNENFRKTISIVNNKEYIPEKEEILFRIFDIVPVSEYYSENFTMNYISERLPFIQNFKDKVKDRLVIMPIDYKGNDVSMIDTLLEKSDKEGKEGLMLYKDVPYKKSKHNGLIKIKTFKFSDLKIIGWFEGEPDGRFAGMFGGFIVEYKGNSVRINGYTDEERAYFTKHADEYIGKIAEVKYKDESMDSKTGLYSLQFGQYQRIREDKDDVSYE